MFWSVTQVFVSTSNREKKTLVFFYRPGCRGEIRLQVRVRPRGLVLDGVPRQPAAGAEDRHGASDQRGGHCAAVALWRKHGVRSGGVLLPAAPLQRRLRLLATHTLSLRRAAPPPLYTWDCHVLWFTVALGKRLNTHTQSGTSLNLSDINTLTHLCSCLSGVQRVHFTDRNSTRVCVFVDLPVYVCTLQLNAFCLSLFFIIILSMRLELRFPAKGTRLCTQEANRRRKNSCFVLMQTSSTGNLTMLPRRRDCSLKDWRSGEKKTFLAV